MSNYDYWNEDYIEHYGTKGQKWGTRKYQYEDGSLTPEGKIRYSKGTINTTKSTNVSRTYATDSRSILDDAKFYQRKSILEESEKYDNSPSGYAIDDPNLEINDNGASMIGKIQNTDIVGENRERDWYLKKEIDRAQNVKISIIDPNYDDPSKRVDNRTLGTKIVDIYKSGLSSIGSWASNLFKK